MTNYITEKELSAVRGAVRSKRGKGEDQRQPYVSVLIEDDGSGLPWEGGINGTFYRISRGSPVSIPANLAKLIRSNASVTYLSERALKEYRDGSGKKL